MHFRVFEFWRLSAALLIMSWHFLRFAPPGYEGVSAGMYRLMPLMEMFFMISGFLIMLRYCDSLGRERGAYAGFIVKRLARFYPLYALTLAFFVFVALAVKLDFVHTDDPGRYDLSTLPANLLLMQAWGFEKELTFNYVSWSLSAEWFCYLTLPAIVLAYRFAGKTGLLAVAIAAIVGLEAATANGLIPFESWLQANTHGAYRAFADFALGAFVAISVRDTAWNLKSHAPGWIVFTLSIVAMATKQDSYVIVGLLGLAMYFSALAERNNPNGSRYLAVFQPLGKVSLGIYLIHPVMESIFFAILWRKVVEPLEIMSFFVWWLLPMAAVIGTAILSDRYFETPISRAVNGWMKSKFGRGKQKAAPEPAVAPAE